MTERQWAPTAARIWFGLTALAVLAGVAISVSTAAVTGGQAWASPVARALNSFAYFTTQSNLIVGVTTLLLALRLDRSSALFRVFRLDGLVMIAITGVVFHTMLAGLLELRGWSSAGNQLVHTVVPLLAIGGWLLFGPRGAITWRVVGLSLIYPISWVVFTLIRGALTGWYPYPFLDCAQLGYPRVSLTLLGITAAFLLLAIGAMYLDRLLLRATGVGANDGRQSTGVRSRAEGDATADRPLADGRGSGPAVPGEGR